ncbi:AAA family ATPase [Streptomyces sp. NPDC057413]|uniref:AAA family ATPase n=1 Tax=Streptomyces sp. NPDC057413 TaxID=3346124 RepID=UPI0036CEB28A
MVDDTLTHRLEHRLGALLAARRFGDREACELHETETIQDALAQRLPDMSQDRTARAPRCVLMSAMPGAGKTHLARLLVRHGLTRLCPDEEMWRRYGHYGRDFPRGEFRVRERPVLDDLAVEVKKLLAKGRDVVFDHGFWTPEERAEWRTLVTEAGGFPLLVYLPVPHEVRWARIKERNQRATVDANAIEFSEEDLMRFAGRFHPPTADEPHIVYNGQPESVLAELWDGGSR